MLKPRALGRLYEKCHISFQDDLMFQVKVAAFSCANPTFLKGRSPYPTTGSSENHRLKKCRLKGDSQEGNSGLGIKFHFGQILLIYISISMLDEAGEVMFGQGSLKT